MSNQMQLQLAAPNKLYCDKPYTMITVPGSEGDVGVLQGHAPMALTIAAGAVDAYQDDKTVADRWFVVGGFCEVVAERCSIMADEVTHMDDLNHDELQAEFSKIKAQPTMDEETSRRLEIIEAKILALEVE